MAPNRREYTVTIGGLPHTIQLSDEDAERYGDAAVLVKPATKPRVVRKKSDK